MALSRRTGARLQASIWPGFVDAMTALLLVLMFLLTIFMVVQFVLRDTITGQGLALDELALEVQGLSRALGLERSRAADLETDLGSANDALEDALARADRQTALVGTLTGTLQTRNAELDQRRAELASFEAQVASLIAERDDARAVGEARAARIADLEGAETRLLSEQEALGLALASAREEIDLAAEQARRAAAEADAFQALIDDLTTEAAARETDLSDALAALAAAREDGRDASERIVALEARLAEEESAVAASTTRLADLEARLAAREGEIAQASAALAENAATLDETAAALDAAEAARLAEAAAAQSLRERLGEQALALDEAEAARLEAAAAAQSLRTRLDDAEAALGDAEAARLAEAAAVAALRDDLAERDAAVRSADAARLAEAAAAAALRERLTDADSELGAMALALEERRREAEEALTLLAAARASADEIRADRDDILSEADRTAALLSVARDQISEQEALTAAEARRVEVLNAQLEDLRAQIGGLQEALGVARADDEAAGVRIEALGEQLNAALARVAAEERARADLEAAERERLERSASEFFGTVRDVFEGRDDVEIVGDRFVFSSEVLFQLGSARLSAEGRRQIASIADNVREIAAAIPDGIDWVLQVDGHTDDQPVIGSGAFADNWELSQARALSVVRYLSETLGLPPERLSANGFGQYRPLDPSGTPQARARNRRIELKFTER